MATVEKSALVPFSAQEMFDLVADVESYVDFLPWCSSSQLDSKTDEQVCGTIEVSRAGVTQSFSTCNKIFNSKDDIIGFSLTTCRTNFYLY